MGAGGAGVRGHMISALQAVAASEGFRWVVLEVVTTHRNPSDRGHWAWDSEVIWGNKTKNTIFAPAQTACRPTTTGTVTLPDEPGPDEPIPDEGNPDSEPELNSDEEEEDVPAGDEEEDLSFEGDDEVLQDIVGFDEL
ncbi:hypothetical protein GGX14DRAFT_407206 [Mycena pura]|uniref:Uncharacterized protein n=1 Tax=Mycena pura TaxID=153505 RepID=A0AAD6Y4P6_9AGAR|nr:hypothetical protein GGX14DRAFT_407206 [Mycena pura]